MPKDENGEGGDNEVGYRKPPKKYQWPKGTSGNLNGAPKKQKREQIDVAGILNEPVSVNKAGARTKVSAFEAGVRQLVMQGLKAEKLNAILQFLEFCETYGVMKMPPISPSGGVYRAPRGVDFEEWLDSITEMVPVSQPDEEGDYD